MKNSSASFRLYLAFIVAALAVPAPVVVHAQEMEDELPVGAVVGAPATPQGARILEVNDENIASLRALSTGPRADAVSLGVSAATLQADAESWQALAIWVRSGGVVFLHSDAARLFGFSTVPAREADSRAPGQLFGRARAALPFAAHPLLFSGISASAGGGSLPPLDQSTRLPSLGVQTVFYQMNAGDQLVVEHPVGTPILRVTDPAGANDRPLYAAAIAPFGSGWAIVVPRLIEQQRADGALFLQNLTRFAQSSASAASGAFAPPVGQPIAPARAEPLVSLPASLIELASQTASDDGDTGVLTAPWNQAIAPPNSAFFADPQEVFAPATEARLVLSRSEAAAFGAALNAANQDETAAAETAQARFRALAYLLRARLELQKGDLKSATDWLFLANEISPNSAEVLLWRGALAASQAQDITLDSPARARLLGEAVGSWSDVLTARSLLQDSTTAPTAVSGIPSAAVQSWIAAATRAGQLMDAEPPLVTVLGRPGHLIVLRYFPDDPTLKLAVPAGDLLARADNFMGWDVEDEEILIFPDERYYVAYSSAARVGSREVAFNPLARRGNVVDNRILMVSQATTNVLIPGNPPRFVPLGSAIPSTLGRLHAQVLVNALAEGGTPVPTWMQLGLMSLSSTTVADGLSPNVPIPDVLRQAAFSGNLLSPDQFRNVNLGEDRVGTIEAQARRLMLYFYARFGAGAVAETLQRLGAGASVEDALLATTGMTEVQFFVAWRNAELGN